MERKTLVTTARLAQNSRLVGTESAPTESVGDLAAAFTGTSRRTVEALQQEEPFIEQVSAGSRAHFLAYYR